MFSQLPPPLDLNPGSPTTMLLSAPCDARASTGSSPLHGGPGTPTPTLSEMTTPSASVSHEMTTCAVVAAVPGETDGVTAGESTRHGAATGAGPLVEDPAGSSPALGNAPNDCPDSNIN